MKISTYEARYRSEAANLFRQNFKSLRRTVPALPDRLENPKEVSSMLDYLFQRCPGVIAVEDDCLVGYLEWFVVERFWETTRISAYVLEWGHATIDDRKPAIYRALYRAATEQWSAVECSVYAITLLAHDQVA